MICLSKADEAYTRKSTWNQAPPPMTSKNTTRQDMNGISNLRELVDADQEGGAGSCGVFDGASSGDTGGGLSPDDDESDDEKSRVRRVDLRSDDYDRKLPCSTELGGEGHFRPSALADKVNLNHLSSWFTWVMSVILTSLILNNLSSIFSIELSSLFASSSGVNDPPTASVPAAASPVEAFSPMDTVISKRGSTCATGGAHHKGYNTPLHGGAVAIIWFVSTLGCSFPILAKRVPGLRIPTRFFFAVRHFGTGVLIATAFVHLLPTAFISLGDPCLSDFWTTDYEAMPGAIALLAIFFVTIIEMVFHPSRHLPVEEQPASAETQPEVAATDPERRHSDATQLQDASSGAGGAALRRTRSESTALPLRGMAPLHGSTANMGYGLNHLQNSEGNLLSSVPTAVANAETRPPKNEFYQSGSQESSSSIESAHQHKLKKERLQCILLELGILFHSVFIGMALSVSVGNDFVVLLIAIVFHQTFEGLALGSRIASCSWGPKSKQPWLMAAAYGCTTPIGQAIGLATASLYSPDSEVGLILVGVMNAISAGLLTYASLVELLSEDFLSDESWKILRGRKRVVACLLVFAGAFFMSLVGAWA